jgi:hypothetical protein
VVTQPGQECQTDPFFSSARKEPPMPLNDKLEEGKAKVGKGVSTAAEKTKDVAGDAYDKTKELAGTAAEKIKEVAATVVEKAKEVAGKGEAKADETVPPPVDETAGSE